MTHKLIAKMSIILIAATIPTMGSATIISEDENNDTLALAQKLTNSVFSTGTDPTTGYGSDIYMFESIPWVSITSSDPDTTSGTNSFDYYSFTVYDGTTGYFDIDYGYDGEIMGSADTYLTLFDSTGVVLEERDDGSDGFQTDPDPGSIGALDGTSTYYYDPSFSYFFDQPGTYYLSVSLYNWDDSFPGQIIGPMALAPNDEYVLQVSLNPAPVPEPTTMLLFGTGLAGLLGSRIRRKKKA
jgi:hypothetical protein